MPTLGESPCTLLLPQITACRLCLGQSLISDKGVLFSPHPSSLFRTCIITPYLQILLPLPLSHIDEKTTVTCQPPHHHSSDVSGDTAVHFGPPAPHIVPHLPRSVATSFLLKLITDGSLCSTGYQLRRKWVGREVDQSF